MFRRKEEESEHDLLSDVTDNQDGTSEYIGESNVEDNQDQTSSNNSSNYSSPIRNAEPAKPASGNNYRGASATEVRSRLQDPRGTTTATTTEKSSKGGGTRRILTVGNDILLKGEIATCDRLVIEGEVDATLNDVHTVEIAETGSFKGTAEIEDAEISGLFEGELIVRNRLVIYSTGQVHGKITYGEIEVERGGEFSGEIQTIGSAGTAKAKKKDAAAA